LHFCQFLCNLQASAFKLIFSTKKSSFLSDLLTLAKVVVFVVKKVDFLVGKTEIFTYKMYKCLALLKFSIKLTLMGRKKVKIYILNQFSGRFFS